MEYVAKIIIYIDNRKDLVVFLHFIEYGFSSFKWGYGLWFHKQLSRTHSSPYSSCLQRFV